MSTSEQSKRTHRRLPLGLLLIVVLIGAGVSFGAPNLAPTASQMPVISPTAVGAAAGSVDQWLAGGGGNHLRALREAATAIESGGSSQLPIGDGCTRLRAALADAKGYPAVPEQSANAFWQRALASAADGVADCDKSSRARYKVDDVWEAVKSARFVKSYCDQVSKRISVVTMSG